MYKLSDTGKKSIEKKTGIKIEDMHKLSAMELDKKIEEKIGKKLTFKQITDIRIIGRGSVYMALGRFFSLDFFTTKFDKYFA
ncbi:MAG TPA: hypothetical protein PLY32_04280 [Salinivirgaceae bacterium]|nr:hypothetical protein [Salinivirgaceae bacterium]HQA76320.1 hypothetical protein [Salinivirgaceae bacterium]